MRKYLFNIIIIIAIFISGLVYIGSLDRQEKQIDPVKVKKTNVALSNQLKVERGWGLGTVDSDGHKLTGQQTTKVSDNYSWTLPIQKVYIDGKAHVLVVVISNDSMQTLDTKTLASIVGHEQDSAYNLLTKGSIDGRYEPDTTLITDLGGQKKTDDTNNYQPHVKVLTESGQLLGKSSVPNKITKDDITIKSADEK